MADEWVLVPREPTEAMVAAVSYEFPRSAPFVFGKLWSAMLAAAPSPPVREEMEGDMREAVARIIDGQAFNGFETNVQSVTARKQHDKDAALAKADAILALPSVLILDDETLARTLYEAMVPPGSGPASLARWASWDEIKEAGAGGERYRIGVRALKTALLGERD